MRKTTLILVGAILLTPVTLIADERTADPKEPDLPAFSVKGRVVDEAGQALAGAKIESLYEGERATAIADDRGSFALDLPRKPRLVLLLRAAESGGERLAFAAYLVDAKMHYMLDRYLAHVETRIPAEVKLVAREPRRADVVVVDTEKRPLADANVFVNATQYQKIAQAVTNGEGKATLLLPVDAPLYAVVAMKPGLGLDYFLYQSPQVNKPRGRSSAASVAGGADAASSSDPYRLPRDHAEPVTLVLNGARRVTVHVIDERGQPLLGVKVYPWYVQKPRKGRERENQIGSNLFDGGALDTSDITDFLATTNEAGQASLDWLPSDGTESISLYAKAPDHIRYESTSVDTGTTDAEATIQLERALRLRGQATFEDGRPATDARVSIYEDALEDGRDSGHRSGRWLTTYADDQGVFQARVFPNHFVVFDVSLDQWAAPIKTCLVPNEAPEEQRIVLRKGIRVYGRLTAGPDNLPVAKHRLNVWRHVEVEYLRLHDQGLRLKPRKQRPGAAPEPEPEMKVIHWTPASTNEKGDYEVFLARGKYQFRYDSGWGVGDEPPLELEVKGEADREINLHLQEIPRAQFAGRVVFDGPDRRGVPDARVTAYYQGKVPYPQVGATTNAKGAFHFDRRPIEMVVYARDQEGTFANLVHVAPDDQSAIIALSKAASAHGRLIDATTSEPIPYVRIYYGAWWHGTPTLQDCGGDVQTDEHGGFTAVGLLPGMKYTFALAGRRPIGWLTTVTVPGTEKVELGGFRIDLTGEAKRSAVGPVAPDDAPAIFDSRLDAKAELAAALEKARAQKKHVLLMFGANWNAWCHRLNACFHDNEEVAGMLQANFVDVLVNVDCWTANGDTDMVNPFTYTNAELPVLVVIDENGIALDTTIAVNMVIEDHYDAEKVLAYLNRWKPGAAVKPGIRRLPRRARPNGGAANQDN